MNKSVRNLTIYQINKCCKCLFICKSIDIYFSTSIISDNNNKIINNCVGVWGIFCVNSVISILRITVLYF